MQEQALEKRVNKVLYEERRVQSELLKQREGEISDLNTMVGEYKLKVDLLLAEEGSIKDEAR